MLPLPAVLVRTVHITRSEAKMQLDYPLDFFGVAPNLQPGTSWRWMAQDHFVFDRSAGGRLVTVRDPMVADAEDDVEVEAWRTDGVHRIVETGGFTRRLDGSEMSLLLLAIRARWCPDLRFADDYDNTRELEARCRVVGLDLAADVDFPELCSLLLRLNSAPPPPTPRRRRAP